MNTFITIENQHLLNPLLKVLSVADSKSMFILGNVLLIKKDGRLSLTTANDGLQITTYSTAEVDTSDGNSAITINAKKLATLLKTFSASSDVTLKINEENEKAVIHCLRSRFNLQTMPSEDFPDFDDDDEVIGSLIISQMEFKKLLKQTQYAIASNDIRHYLNGLLLDIKPHKIMAVATNGHRLAYASQTFEEELPTASLLIPRNTILELNRLLFDNNYDLTITIRKNSVKFEFNEVVLISKLIDGKFPEYSNLFPAEFNAVCKIGKNELINAIKQVITVSDRSDFGVTFEFADNNLKVIGRNNDDEIAEAELSVQYQGEPMSASFNCSYLLEKLQTITDDLVLFRLIDQDSSMTITGFNSYNLDESQLKQIPLENNGDDKTTDYDEDGDFVTKFYEKYIVMPVRI